MGVTVGDLAPEFELPSHRGGKVRLSSSLRKENCARCLSPSGLDSSLWKSDVFIRE